MIELPRYKEIYESLRRQIADGVYSPGDLLPSEHIVSRQFGVTRPTVRKALEMLAGEGIIDKHQGKVSIVKGSPKGIGILSLSGTTSAIGEAAMETRIIVPPQIRGWSQAFIWQLTEEEKQAGCIYFERVRVIEGSPVILEITMLPNRGIPGFTDFSMENASLFDILRTKYQIVVRGGVQQLYAIAADQRLHANLQVRAGYPILQLNRKIETSLEGFYIYSQVFCVTANYSLSGTF